MKIMLDEVAKMPTRAHEFDAGLDLYTPKTVSVHGSKYTAPVYNHGYGMVGVGQRVIDTGVHVEIPAGYVGLIKSKSGLMVNNGLLTDGTIDSGYTGSIKVKLFNTSPKDYKFNAGDKIAQLVIVPCLLPELELVDHLEETDRGDGGFGSTGR
jgi:dUTP pyrophosphatase